MSHVFYLTGRLEDLPSGTEWLTAAEREVLAGLRFEKRSNDWLLGRWTAKRALGAAVGLEDCDLTRWQIIAASDGAPEVCFDGVASDLAISISHRNNTAMCAVAPLGHAIGCDIELIENRDPAFIKTFLTRREQIGVSSAATAMRAAITTFIWSAKESVLKMTRQGLRADTWTIEVDIPLALEQGIWHPLYARQVDSGGTFHGWWQRDRDLIATIVADRSPHIPTRLDIASKRAS